MMGVLIILASLVYFFGVVITIVLGFMELDLAKIGVKAEERRQRGLKMLRLCWAWPMLLMESMRNAYNEAMTKEREDEH